MNGFPLTARIAVLLEVVARRRGRRLNLLMLHLPALLTDAGVELRMACLHKAARPVVRVDAARFRGRRVLLRLEKPRVRLTKH